MDLPPDDAADDAEAPDSPPAEQPPAATADITVDPPTEELPTAEQPTEVPSGKVGHRSRYVAAVLDALIPGVGHLVARRWQRALVVAAPLLVIASTALWLLVTVPLPRLAASLVSESVIWALLTAQGIVLASRLVAVGSSLFDPALPRPGRRDVLPIAVLLAFVIAPQAYIGYATEVAREAADQIFIEPVAVTPSTSTPAPDPSVLSTAGPNVSPGPSPGPAGDRITGLILGVDSGVGRSTYLTDTMIVVSLDRSTRTVSMLSIPRDMVDVPLPDGRLYQDKVNSLVAYARHHIEQFPGSDGTGFDVLMSALGTLTSTPIDYYAKVDLGGFVRVINVLGGVDVNVAHSFCDPNYHEYGFTNGFSITAGRHRLDGQQALAYARVRKASGESDFTRAARQQEVVSGIRDAVVGGGFLNDPIGLLKALGATVVTNVPRDLLPDLAELATQVGREQTYRAVVNHPLVKPGFDVRGSIQIPDVVAIRSLAASLFPTDGSLPSADYLLPKRSSGSASGSGVGGCLPVSQPTPTPAPTADPNASSEPSLSLAPSASTEPSPTAESSPSLEPSASP